MKITVIIDKEREEEVMIYARQKNRLVDEIEQLINEDICSLMGYKGREAIRLNITDIYCFIIENNKIYALTEKDKLHIKSRLYKIEEGLPKSFVKINQSCIANIKKIEKFEASFGGALTVIFKNGFSDYVSRRNLKNVKERLGL